MACCLLTGGVAARGATSADGAATGWHIVPSPSVASGGNTLEQVSGNWAVGYYGGPGSFRTLTEHWTGTKWSFVRSQDPTPQDNVLTGVSSQSPTNTWAVGYDLPQTSGRPYHRALTEHWNGKTWTVVPARQAGTADNDLWGVAALSADNVWAVGNENVGSFRFRPLAEHWDGTAWKVVATPTPPLTGTGASLYSLTAVSASDLWAVGETATATGFKPLIEHWNGMAWSLVSAVTDGSSGLNQISMSSATNGWAVGSRQAGPNSEAIVEHWDGHRWSLVGSPAIKNSNLTGVLTLSANLAWAVGNYLLSDGHIHTLIEQWNGHSWAVVSSPSRTPSSELLGIGGTARQMWAVGDSLTTTLIMGRSQ